MAGDIVEDHDRTSPGFLQLENNRRHLITGIHGLADAQQLIGMFAFNEFQEATQALPVEIGVIVGHRRGCSSEMNNPILPVSATKVKPARFSALI